jgi:hypothetical protein
MARHVDLSAPELQPDAVVNFIEAHAKDRPSSNVLFRISQEALDLFGSRKQGESVPASTEETQTMNEFLGKEWQPSDYLMDSRIECSSCGRVLTFYDVFETARQSQHSDAFLQRVLASGEPSLQVAGRDENFEIRCTGCGTLNNISLEATHTYHAKEYCYC